jgi:hypothetical protein
MAACSPSKFLPGAITAFFARYNNSRTLTTALLVTPLALLCYETFSRPLGNSKKENKRFQSSVAFLPPFTTVAQKLNQGAPKSGVHRFRAPFLCSFLLEMQKKGGESFPVQSIFSFFLNKEKKQKKGGEKDSK